MKRQLGISTGLLLLVAGTAFAAEGRKEIFQPVVLDGNVADISGRYFVSRNITSSGSVIDISGTGTETIDIDLNGFTLTGTGDLPPWVVRINSVRDIRIHDGTISAQDPDSWALFLFDSGLTDDRAAIENVRTIGGLVGIEVAGVQSVDIRNNIVTGAQFGIQVGVGDTNTSGFLEDNLIREVAQTGFHIEGTVNFVARNNRAVDVSGTAMFFYISRGLRVEHNAVSGDGDGIGIDIATGCTVIGNNVTEIPGGAFGLGNSSGCLFQDNVAKGNLGSGLFVGSSYGNKIRGNVITGNSANGMILFDDSNRNLIEDNTLVDNGDYGLLFVTSAGGNVYRGNFARGNAGAPCGTATCGAPDFCDLGAGNTSAVDNFLPGPPPC